MPERLRSALDRRAVFITAQVVREGKPNLPCVVIDISQVGARLSIAQGCELPERFTLIMTERGVPRRLCRLVWRGEAEAGVSFEAEPKGVDRTLAPGSTLDEALDVFALRP